MCLIVVKTDDDAKFSDENFTASFNRNSDGIGMMWLEDGRVRVERLIGTLAQQKALFDRHKDKEVFAMHHRLATHGSKEKMFENCHPFKIMDMDDGDPMDIYLMHNGVISGYKQSDTTFSDTWNFVENHLKPILKADPELLYNDGFQIMVTDFIGGGNKLVVMSNHPTEANVLIFNKDKGETVDKCWLSNTNNINTGKKAVTQYPYNNAFRNNAWQNDDYEAYNGYWNGRTQPESKKNESVTKETDISADSKEVCEVETLRSYSEITNQDAEAWKTEVRSAIMDGTMNIEDPDVKELFTEEELNTIQDELDELNDKELDEFNDKILAIYDPEHISHESMENLLDRMGKEFVYADLELLVEVNPQVAADVIQALLDARNSNKLKVKAA